jgi:hypothetical protein
MVEFILFNNNSVLVNKNFVSSVSSYQDNPIYFQIKMSNGQTFILSNLYTLQEIEELLRP